MLLKCSNCPEECIGREGENLKILVATLDWKYWVLLGAVRDV